MAFTLHISGPFGSKTVKVETELTIGRTDQANFAIDDSGLSRINTTFFVDDEMFWGHDRMDYVLRAASS